MQVYTCMCVRMYISWCVFMFGSIQPMQMCLRMHVFLPYGDVLKGMCMPLRLSVTVHMDSVYAVYVSLKSVGLRGLTGELGLNLNAGHRAACRFRFCLSPLLCAQDGNPPNMARIPIKSNNLLPPTVIEAVSSEGTDGAPSRLGR